MSANKDEEEAQSQLSVQPTPTWSGKRWRGGRRERRGTFIPDCDVLVNP